MNLTHFSPLCTKFVRGKNRAWIPESNLCRAIQAHTICVAGAPCLNPTTNYVACELPGHWIHPSVGILSDQASLEFATPLDLARGGPAGRPTVMIMQSFWATWSIWQGPA